MTGPEHYREAERLIGEAHTLQYEQGPGMGADETLLEAQVHATLALVAATALLPRVPTTQESQAWIEATS